MLMIEKGEKCRTRNRRI